MVPPHPVTLKSLSDRPELPRARATRFSRFEGRDAWCRRRSAVLPKRTTGPKPLAPKLKAPQGVGVPLQQRRIARLKHVEAGLIFLEKTTSPPSRRHQRELCRRSPSVVPWKIKALKGDPNPENKGYL